MCVTLTSITHKLAVGLGMLQLHAMVTRQAQRMHDLCAKQLASAQCNIRISQHELMAPSAPAGPAWPRPLAP